ncbi:hypothetical protein PIB30_063320 [Stylosanthes scabra]|uniref:Uncharacterized protein n=1 Tax=Stylosanthes scabra TaxID=79078 RepID=A0ABU6TMR3_9FABA|nr:hypothetical protein [Stylosanthes scabra]
MELLMSSLLLLFLSLLSHSSSMASNPTPTPSEWPLQFHSLIWHNRTGILQKWNNGTSFYYTLDPYKKECNVMHFPVGILRPNWLDGATYLGQRMVDNFLCNV